jgi:uroporphyrinogen-III synthase
MTGGALVTRPREDAGGVARALEARGFAVHIEPLLAVTPLSGVALPLDGSQGYLATSANGVRALAANDAPRDLPLWAVGDATARTARDLGFSQVESAKGDAATLSRLVTERVDPAAGTLLHAAGTKVAGDLSAGLAALGYRVRREILYEACTAESLSAAAIRALKGEAVDLALFFSPRTAQTFVTLASAAGCADAGRAVSAYALSPAVAEALSVLPWRRILTAERPLQDSLLACLDRVEGI